MKMSVEHDKRLYFGYLTTYCPTWRPTKSAFCALGQFHIWDRSHLLAWNFAPLDL